MRRVLICAVAALALLAAPAEAQTAKVYRSASPVTPGTSVPAGDGVALACSAAGNQRLVMSDGTFLDVYAQVGTAIIDNMSVQGAVGAPTSTAICVVTVLRIY